MYAFKFSFFQIDIIDCSDYQQRKLSMAETIDVFTAQMPNILASLNISNISIGGFKYT